ncbi:unnamed protein product [Leptidea sinapis]|uniref:Uncharacterized protein n=1 Tax=Leptidea sinapis TaxID=189913 RepID=A0A5E4PRB8_9NEOP|nr:unnamed protein product [Leptidea sinapis]
MAQWSGAHRAYAVEAYLCNGFSLSEARLLGPVESLERLDLFILSDADSLSTTPDTSSPTLARETSRSGSDQHSDSDIISALGYGRVLLIEYL